MKFQPSCPLDRLDPAITGEHGTILRRTGFIASHPNATDEDVRHALLRIIKRNDALEIVQHAARLARYDKNVRSIYVQLCDLRWEEMSAEYRRKIEETLAKANELIARVEQHN